MADNRSAPLVGMWKEAKVMWKGEKVVAEEEMVA